MFSNEIFEIITHGREEVNIEYKDSMSWKSRYAQLEIIRAMLAMANTEGGYIVVGVKEEKDKRCNPVGMEDEHYKSFNHDYISSKIKNYCDPDINFNVVADASEINGIERKFIVIEMSESKEPIICSKGERQNKKSDWLPGNIALRKNAIYIRSKTPVESREISSAHEWRQLINKIVEKNKSELMKRMPCSFLEVKKIIPDSNKFDDDLIKDKL